MFADTGSASACIPQYHHAAERLHDFTVGIDVAADTWEREVRPQAEAPDAIKQTVLARLRELGFLLVARGLSVRVDANHWCLTVINNAAEPDNPSDPLAVAYGSVMLIQRVYLALDDDDALCWYWEWSGPDRNEPGEYELLCPGGAITQASERITRVLALRDEPVEADE